MPRPPCCRRIAGEPGAVLFKPAGVPGRALEAVVLALDEFEAVRLADLEGLYQEQAAERMGVSRPTVSRILEAAHRKIADVLVNGKALRIEGGNVHLAVPAGLRCPRCSGSPRDASCPRCHRKVDSNHHPKRGQP